MRNQSMSLRKKLMYSHLTVATLCFMVLLAALTFNIWLSKQTQQLTEATNPIEQLNLRDLYNAIKNTRTLVFESVALDNTDNLDTWEQTWNEIWEHLNKLDSRNSSLESDEQFLIHQLKHQIVDLESNQWRLMDILATEGNYPANVLLKGEVFHVGQNIRRGLDTLLEHETSKNNNTSSISTIKNIADLRATYIHFSTDLHRFTINADPMDENNLEEHKKNINTILTKLEDNKKTNGPQYELIQWLKGEFSYYFTLSNKVVDVRKSKEWNVAQYLLMQNVIPLIKDANLLIEQLSNKSLSRIEQSRMKISLILERNLFLSSSLLFIMLLIGYFSAKYLANKIVSPIEDLAAATLKFGQNQQPVKVTANGNDELGMLAKSFNFMQDALLRKQKDLQRLATTDSLTGLANRHSFTEAIENEWKRCLRDKQEICVVMIDVDHFKLYNDQYGHQAGDTALKAVADVIQQNLHRPSDLAARYGGEEFIIVLPQTSMHGATKIANKISYALEARKIPAAKGASMQILSISCGIANCIPGEEISDWEQLVKSSDDALYQAKKRGRNQICKSHVNNTILCEIPTDAEPA